MTPPFLLDPEHPDALARVVHRLVVEGEALVEVMNENLVALTTAKTRRVYVLARASAIDDGMYQRLKKVLRHGTGKSIEAVVFGGDDEVPAKLRAILPRFSRARAYVYQRRDDGEVVRINGKPRGADTLLSYLDGGGDGALDWDRFAERVAAGADVVAEKQGFVTSLRGRRPLATWTLCASFVVWFGLEYAFGGVETVPTLVRMGALWPPRLLEGELHRLIAPAFLHAGFMHLAFNTWVLLALGSFTEQLLGTRRFLLLYTGSAVGGAVASALFVGERFSVGASGALWGVLAATAIFAFAPGFLPAAMLPAARRAAMINLGINLLNSFRPHVDMAGHFGGGLAGAFLLYFVLSRGVPRGEALATERPSNPRWLRAAAVACVAVLAAGPLVGLALGKPWEIARPAPAERVALAPLGLSVEVPGGLGAPRITERGGGVVEAAFGQLEEQAAVLGVIKIPLPAPVAAAEIPEALDEMAEQLSQAPGQGRVAKKPRRVPIGDGREAVVTRYVFDNGVRLDVAGGFVGGVLVRVEVAIWPQLAGSRAGLAQDVFTSARPAGT
jgi:membrane associated rhomboid family serine protease